MFNFRDMVDSRQDHHEYLSSFGGRHSRKSKDLTPPRNSTIPRDKSPSTHTWKSSTMPRRYSPSPLPPKSGELLPTSPPPYVHPKDKDCECQCECRSSYYHSHEVRLNYRVATTFTEIYLKIVRNSQNFFKRYIYLFQLLLIVITQKLLIL